MFLPKTVIPVRDFKCSMPPMNGSLVCVPSKRVQKPTVDSALNIVYKIHAWSLKVNFVSNAPMVKRLVCVVP